MTIIKTMTNEDIHTLKQQLRIKKYAGHLGNYLLGVKSLPFFLKHSSTFVAGILL